MLAQHGDIVNLEDITDDISKTIKKLYLVILCYYDTIYVIYKNNLMYYSLIT